MRSNQIIQVLLAAAAFLTVSVASPHNLTSIAPRDFEIANSPGQGRLYLKRYWNEYERISAQDDTGEEDDMRMTILNGHKTEIMWLWLEYGSGKIRIEHYTDPNRPWEHKIRLLPGESVEFGHFGEHTEGGSEQFSGGLRVFRDCDMSGEGCFEDPNAVTKWEFTGNPDFHKNNIGINLSLVDGFNVRGYLSYGEGSTCLPFPCVPKYSDAWHLCPIERRIKNGRLFQCKSDCKVTGSFDDCSSETHPSSLHLKKICPAGYAWSADHSGTYSDCDPKGEILLTIL